MSNLAKLREYDIDDPEKGLTVKIPIQYLRDRCQPGTKLGCFRNTITDAIEFCPLDSEGRPIRKVN